MQMLSKTLILATGGILCAGMLRAQLPFTSPWVDEVLNAASQVAPEAPNGGIAPGSMFAVTGVVLGPSELKMINQFPLVTQLEGTSVQVKVEGRSWDAYLIYSWYWQLAAILPSDVPVGEGTLTVTYQGKTSSPAPMRIVPNSFGTFARNEAGSGPGIVQNFVSGTELPVNALTAPAQPGQVEILWGTGLGAARGDETAGPIPGEMAIDLDVIVGGKPATVLYKGRSGCCAGIDQIVFEVPEGVEGCYVPVVVRAGEVFSNYTTMSVASSGETCPDLPGLNSIALDKLQRSENLSVGRIELMRVTEKVEMPGYSGQVFTDYGFGHFTRYPPYRLLASQSVRSLVVGGPPSPGSCLILPRDDVDTELLLPTTYDPVWGSRGERLDAGIELSLAGIQGDRQLDKQNEQYSGFLGGMWPDPFQSWPGYLEPGAYRLNNGAGGQDVGSFDTSFDLPEPVMWLNQVSTTLVRRDQDLTVTWSSSLSEKQVVLVYASSWAQDQNYFPMALLCAERATAGQFTVPSWMLSQLPPSGSSNGWPMGFLGLITTAAPEEEAVFTAAGLDDGRWIYALAELKWLAFE